MSARKKANARVERTRRAPALSTDALLESLHFVTVERGGRKIPLRMAPEQHQRLQRLAALSGVTVDRWLDTTIASSLARDEQHWKEMQDRARMAADVDRGLFARLSRTHLADLPPEVIDRLVEQLVLARERGRTEGYVLGAVTVSGLRCPLASEPEGQDDPAAATTATAGAGAPEGPVAP